MLTLANTFHGTKARIRATPGAHVSRRTERRVWRALCGMEGCTCSGAGGVRGGAYVLTCRTAWPEQVGGRPFTVERRA